MAEKSSFAKILKSYQISKPNVIIVVFLFFLIIVTCLIVNLIVPYQNTVTTHLPHICPKEEKASMVWPNRKNSCQKFGSGQKLPNMANITLSYQMPLPRNEEIQRFYRRQEKMVSQISIDFEVINDEVPEIRFESLLAIKVGAKNTHDQDWKIIDHHLGIRINKTCKKLANNHFYYCDGIPLFELQNMFYDHYLVNMDFFNFTKDTEYHPIDIWMNIIVKDETFAKANRSRKMIYFCQSLGLLIYAIHKMCKSQEERTMIQIHLMLIVIFLTIFNIPFEYIHGFNDVPWVPIVITFQSGLFHAAILVLFATTMIMDLHTFTNNAKSTLVVLEMLSTIGLFVILYMHENYSNFMKTGNIFHTEDPNILRLSAEAGITIVMLYTIFMFFPVIRNSKTHLKWIALIGCLVILTTNIEYILRTLVYLLDETSKHDFQVIMPSWVPILFRSVCHFSICIPYFFSIS